MATSARPRQKTSVPRANGRLIAIRAQGENKKLIEEVVPATVWYQ
jgi:hypothetical protein